MVPVDAKKAAPVSGGAPEVDGSDFGGRISSNEPIAAGTVWKYIFGRDMGPVMPLLQIFFQKLDSVADGSTSPPIVIDVSPMGFSIYFPSTLLSRHFSLGFATTLLQTAQPDLGDDSSVLTTPLATTMTIGRRTEKTNWLRSSSLQSQSSPFPLRPRADSNGSNSCDQSSPKRAFLTTGPPHPPNLMCCHRPS